MPFGAALSEGSSGEQVNHFSAIKVRSAGNGPLTMIVYSLDDLKTKTLVPFQMSPKNRIIPTRLVNFVEQRASFELRVDVPGVNFKINRIVIFVRELYSSYPGS